MERIDSSVRELAANARRRFAAFDSGDEKARVCIPDRAAAAVRVQPQGLIGRELEYTMAGWVRMGFQWERQGLDALEAVITGAIRTIWIWSTQPGTGKTGFGVCALKAWAEERRSPCGIIRMPAMSQAEFRERNRIAKEIAQLDFVLIDDIQRLKFSGEYNAEWLHSFIDELYLNKVPVIVTANAALKAVSNVAGNQCDAAFDRLKDGGYLEVEATGPSRRG